MSTSISITGSIKATDNVPGTLALSKVFTALTTPTTTFAEASGLTAGTSPVTVILPISPATFVYIKNTHATQTLLVTWTPNGGASNPVITLQPGSYVMFGEAVQALSGITAMTVTGSSSGTTFEYVCAG